MCVLVSRLTLSVCNHNHAFNTGLCLQNKPHNDSYGISMVMSILTLLDIIWIVWTDKTDTHRLLLLPHCWFDLLFISQPTANVLYIVEQYFQFIFDQYRLYLKLMCYKQVKMMCMFVLRAHAFMEVLEKLSLTDSVVFKDMTFNLFRLIKTR